MPAKGPPWVHGPSWGQRGAGLLASGRPPCGPLRLADLQCPFLTVPGTRWGATSRPRDTPSPFASLSLHFLS